jgi:putative restriction endonuclease
MDSVVNVKGTIHGLGRAKLYADGTEPMEITVPKNSANGLPYSIGNRTPIDLLINGEHYHAVILSTEENPVIYISQSVKTKDGVSEKLSYVLTNAGFKNKDKVRLEIYGHNIVLKAESFSPFAVDVVTELDQVSKNIAELERGRVTGSQSDADEYRSLIKRGTCFVPYGSLHGLAFAPSRFVGYIGNKLATHADNPDRDGRVTNAALNKLLGSQPYANAMLESRYLAFCSAVGVKPSQAGAFGVPRKYWITQEIAELLEVDAERKILQDPNINETEKRQLVKARVGQGQFRDRLLSFWEKCCLTGCEHQAILRASHIKPWREGNNAERLDVFNGLLLTPNMDALFDKGLISFKDSGEILISPELTDESQKVLGCSPKMKISLRPEHAKYIAWHRENLYVGAAA